MEPFLQVKEALQFDTFAGTQCRHLLRALAFRGLRT
jgi:hypothetical protein